MPCYWQFHVNHMVKNKESKYSIWQLAGGSLSRSYYDVFLQYGVGLIGPGDSGPWHDYRTEAEFNGSFVRRFASEMQIGDIVLLRVGMSTAIPAYSPKA